MKRIFCLTLAILVMMLSVVTFTASAESVPGQSTNPDCIYFQVPTETNIAWKNFSIVFCHIWQEGDEGGDFYPWQAKDERCTDLGNGYWSYDISQFDFKEDGKYSVIFSNENGMQTYNLSITSACKGDIVYCDGDTCVNPVDSSKQCTIARWMENKDTVHPCAMFGSDGALVDPDGIFNTDVDLTWGTSEGASINMPKVEVPVEETKADEPTDDDTNTDALGDTASVSVLSIILMIGIPAVVIIVAAVVIVLALSKRKKN